MERKYFTTLGLALATTLLLSAMNNNVPTKQTQTLSLQKPGAAISLCLVGGLLGLSKKRKAIVD